MRHRPNHRDVQASLIAAAATLVTILLNGPTPEMGPVQPRSERAMDGLITAEQAKTEGAWLLDEPEAAARLSFAPEHDRLVWHVEGGDADVLIDAKTGEALEFQFE